MSLFTLVALTLLLLLVGYAGCALAQRLRLPSLVGGIELWLALAHIAMPGYRPQDLWSSDDAAQRELTEYQDRRRKDRTILESTGVTPIALEEFDADTRHFVEAMSGRITQARADERLRFNLAIAYPAVMVALGVALLATPQRAGFAYHLPFVLAGSLSAAAISALAGWAVLSLGWIGSGAVAPGLWLLGLTLGCAVASVPLPRGGPVSGDPLWRSVFEPLLYAAVASQVDLIGGFDLLLMILVLILFADAKALGAVLLRHYVSGRAWGESLRIGLGVARGGPTAVAVAYAIYALGMIDVRLYTALVVANVLAAALAPMLDRMIAPAAPAAAGSRAA